MDWEAMVFDLRTEAEMRLYSDKVARELAERKGREGNGEKVGEEQAVTAANVATEGERGA
ncbi:MULTISPECIES: hypothetical protein [Streptomyces]|uniref:Uncharacterized protein n=1 Tax=Streptomyces sviceus (strain ATCC 29083 / DSM 924 / JCM 4929 / NBRC 13980 / NCIMB 11184 / NRRL 5439 / UC 5370) TaxID=463191 RepID=B5I597_STRX2|nr:MULTISPECIES: hypothetical protein [Streptomyces]EDY60252.1 conserved hypothetical protein [Streptomyces sviceus ATCC 29083]MYT03996.1 hypothetical protein [Streptomyces sp. SID5470]